jgi:hypothetical protein
MAAAAGAAVHLQSLHADQWLEEVWWQPPHQLPQLRHHLARHSSSTEEQMTTAAAAAAAGQCAAPSSHQDTQEGEERWVSAAGTQGHNGGEQPACRLLAACVANMQH